MYLDLFGLFVLRCTRKILPAQEHLNNAVAIYVCKVLDVFLVLIVMLLVGLERDALEDVVGNPH